MPRPAPIAEPGRRLVRRLGLADAVVMGLGAMLGAGVFAALGPAADAAGPALLAGLAVAGLVAYCNATSSAALAAVHPEAGGTYVYGRERLGPVWGYMAGWGFVVGKTASCAAMALTFGAYVWPGAARPLAAAVVVAVTGLNLLGVRRSAQATWAIVVMVLAVLAAVVLACLAGGTADAANLEPTGEAGVRGVLEAAGLLFFAFAGYARIATMGEEVRDPARVIPRAIPLALGIVLAAYLAVAVAALAALGAAGLAAADAPLEAAVSAGSLDGLAPVVRAAAAVASAGVLLSLMLGVSRTALAMSRRGDLPRVLDAVSARTGGPHRAELAVGAVVLAVVLAADLRGAIGFSSFCVLAYYAVANASALRLRPEERRWPRGLAAAGLAACVVVAVSLPAASVLAGTAVLAAGAVLWVARAALRRA